MFCIIVNRFEICAIEICVEYLRNSAYSWIYMFNGQFSFDFSMDENEEDKTRQSCKQFKDLKRF